MYAYLQAMRHHPAFSSLYRRPVNIGFRSLVADYEKTAFLRLVSRGLSDVDLALGTVGA